MTLRKILALCTLTAASLTAGAQTLLGGAEVSMKLPANFSAGLEAEYRSAHWFRQSNQWSIAADAAYKPLKWLKLGVAYKFIQAHNPATTDEALTNPAYWVNKHRVSVSVAGEWKPWKHLSFSLRERYQYTYRPSLLVPQFDEGIPYGNRTVNSKSKHILRSRLTAEVKLRKKCPFTPYASFELYSLLKSVNHTKHRTENGRANDKWRLQAGCDYKINKRNTLELFYRYTHNADADDVDEPHTIGLLYKFKLR